MTKPNSSSPDPSFPQQSLSGYGNDHLPKSMPESQVSKVEPEPEVPRLSDEEVLMEQSNQGDDVGKPVISGGQAQHKEQQHPITPSNPDLPASTLASGTFSVDALESQEVAMHPRKVRAQARARAKARAKARGEKKRRKTILSQKVQIPILSNTKGGKVLTTFLRKFLQFRGWPWFLVIGLSGATGVSAFAWLSKLPPIPNCSDQLASTWTDAGRLYCADQAARKQDPKALSEALAMVGNWDEADPIFEQAQKLADTWSRSILEVARKTLEAGNLKEAIALANKVPKLSPQYETAQQNIKIWEADWKDGEDLLETARESIQQQDWALATAQLRQLSQLEGEHWQKRSEKLISEMAIEQSAFRILNLADDRARGGTIKDIKAALKLSTTIDPKRLARKRIPNYADKWSKRLIELADYYYEIGDYESAIQAARTVPPGSKLGDQAQALLQASQAKIVTQDETVFGFVQAIALLEQVPKTADVLDETELELSEWEAQVQSWSQVQFAKLFSRFDQGAGYDIAIQHASLVEVDSPRRIEAQSLIAQWDKQRASIPDRQAIARATILAKATDLSQVRAAIAEAQKVRPDSPFRVRAQTLIAEWESSIERKEDQPILDKAIALAKAGNLDAAINTADKIDSDRALYYDAQDKIAEWVADIQIAQDRPILNDAEALARNGQLSAAINRASEIGYGRALYYEAQDRIGDWAYQLDQIAAANRRAYEREQEAARQNDYYEEERYDAPQDSFQNAPEDEEYVDSASGAGASGVPDF